MNVSQALAIERDFRGAPLPEEHRAVLRLARSGAHLRIELDAPYFGDPAPAVPVGPTERLWEHEVCELFIADAGEHYLEVELSPHGHHLVLELSGIRRVVRSQLPIDYVARIEVSSEPPATGPIGRFYGEAHVPWAYLPVPALRANAYAIHGHGAGPDAGQGVPQRRCYHAHSPPGGAVADFHKLASFVSLRLA